MLGSKKENVEVNKNKHRDDKEDVKSLFLKYGYGPIMLCDQRFERVIAGNEKGTGRTLTKKNR